MSEEKKRYQIRFDAEGCIGAGKCAEEAPEFWKLNIETGIAEPLQPTFDQDDLEQNLRAAKACPARNGRGVIRIIDRKQDKTIY